MYLLDTESHGNIFFFSSQQTTQPMCKVSQSKDPINFAGVTGFLAFSFPSSSFLELVALSHFSSMSMEVSPPKQHTQAKQEATQAIGPAGLGITHRWVCPQCSAQDWKKPGRGNTFQLIALS